MDVQSTLSELSEALQKDDPELICDILLKNPEFINHPSCTYVNRTLLNKAKNDWKYQKVIEIIYDSSNFENFGDFDFESFLNRVILQGNTKLLEFLLMKGVKLNDLSASRFVFLKTNMSTRKEKLLLLMKYGFNTGVVNIADQNLLHYFTSNFLQENDEDAVEVADILVNAKLSVNNVDKTGMTPLIRSIYAEHHNLISYLIEKGAAINMRGNSGDFPLQAAAVRKNKNIINLLLSKGAKINAKNGFGWTALHRACFEHSEEIISLLISKGAKVNAKDLQNKTPFCELQIDKENYKQCRATMLKALSKLKFENLISSVDMAIIQTSLEAMQCFKNYLTELERMANTKFYSSYSYYSVMKKSIDIKKLANLMKNEELVSKFEKYSCTLFYFEKDLRKIFEEGIEVRNRHDEVISRLKSVFEKCLIEDVIKILANYLTVEDLPLYT